MAEARRKPATDAAIAGELVGFYDALEREIEGPPPALPWLLRAGHVLVSAVAVGALAAGLSIFAIFVLLNVIFHFVPS